MFGKRRVLKEFISLIQQLFSEHLLCAMYERKKQARSPAFRMPTLFT